MGLPDAYVTVADWALQRESLVDARQQPELPATRYRGSFLLVITALPPDSHLIRINFVLTMVSKTNNIRAAKN